MTHSVIQHGQPSRHPQGMRIRPDIRAKVLAVITRVDVIVDAEVKADSKRRWVTKVDPRVGRHGTSGNDETPETD